MSGVVPGLIGTFRPGTLVVMSGRTSQDVLSCPKTSWDFCSGIVRKVRGSPGHVSTGFDPAGCLTIGVKL